MPKLHVEVTREHIIDGAKCKGDACPVALAIIDALQAAKISTVIPSVGPTFVEFTVSDIPSCGLVELPLDAMMFINRFDAGLRPIDPFEFDLEVSLSLLEHE